MITVIKHTVEYMVAQLLSQVAAAQQVSHMMVLVTVADQVQGG